MPMMDVQLTAAPRTQTVPVLEFYPPGSSTPEQARIATFPFTIGRSDICDVTVASKRVSREHAVIECDGPRYVLKDLHSTNGTFVNGRRIREANLRDGDLITVADAELTFFTGTRDSAEPTAAPVVTIAQDDARQATIGFVRAVRRSQQAAIGCGVQIDWRPIVELASGAAVAYQASPCSETSPTRSRQAEHTLRSLDCHVTARLRYVQRLVAAEQASRIADNAPLMLNVAAAEIGDDLVRSLDRLKRVLGRHRLVVSLPDQAVGDLPYFREFLESLRRGDVGVAYDGFAGGRDQLLQHREIAPDYLRLASSYVAEVPRSDERQRQLRELADASREAGCRLIVSGLQDTEHVALCLQAGCELGQGEFYALPPVTLRQIWRANQ